MKSVICTLFEGNYHYGVATLCNSLIKQGFKGDLFVGYRGQLPTWVLKQDFQKTQITNDHLSANVNNAIQLHFLKLETNYHLTNYKPDFMLRLIENEAANSNAIFYADPDLVFNAPWHFFEAWVNSGVAVCEDLNSPLPQFHPRRVAWRNFFNPLQRGLQFKEPYYANGGFVGLKVADKAFLETWKLLQEDMAIIIGGLNKSSLTGEALASEDSGAFAPFSKTDQDALNAAIESTSCIVSFLGKEAMGFVPGVACLPHALGSPKPWNWNMIKQALSGRPPSSSVKAYFDYANSTIICYEASELKIKKLKMRIAAFIGRFYTRYDG